MAKSKRKNQAKGELVAVRPAEVTVAPPQSGSLGEFLSDTENMFRVRGMRMKALFGKINETGQRMEGLLRIGAQMMEAAEARLEDDLRGQGLFAETTPDSGRAENGA